MKGKFVPVAIVLSILLVLSAGLSAAQGPAPQGTGPQASVSTAFTYQGQLKKDGTLVNATCTMVFSLYDDAAAGSRQGDPITLTVTVADGLFTAVLNSGGEFGLSTFDGTALWLEVAVQCPGDAGFNTLAPRQALTAAPYALSLRPGALIDGDTSLPVLRALNHGSGGGLYGYSYATSGTSYGVFGHSGSPDGRGVYGWNTADSGTARAVYGVTDSTAGIAVSGYATADSGVTLGVNGQSDSINGRGVYGYAGAITGTNWGVYGLSHSDDGIGVAGYANATSGTTIGVSGQVESPTGIAVYGLATASTGTPYGLYGVSHAPAGIGVYGLSDSTGNQDLSYGVFGEARAVSNAGVYGYNSVGAGVRGESHDGTAILGYNWQGNGPMLVLQSFGLGDLIQAYGGWSPHELRFRVDTAGNVYADGTYNTPIPGFAQMLPGPAGLEIGDVLVVGPDGSLARCDMAYQPTVVGVYAPQAGLISGNSADTAGQVPLAVMGVVTVKVSAENGPIRPGDLLVAAATPGHAMCAGANPALGTVIGKALGSLDKDTGTLLMLVMLR